MLARQNSGRYSSSYYIKKEADRKENARIREIQKLIESYPKAPTANISPTKALLYRIRNINKIKPKSFHELIEESKFPIAPTHSPRFRRLPRVPKNTVGRRKSTGGHSNTRVRRRGKKSRKRKNK